MVLRRNWRDKKKPPKGITAKRGPLGISRYVAERMPFWKCSNVTSVPYHVITTQMKTPIMDMIVLRITCARTECNCNYAQENGSGRESQTEEPCI